MTNTLGAPPASLMIVGEVASSGLARGGALLCDCARKPTLVPRRELGVNGGEKARNSGGALFPGPKNAFTLHGSGAP